MGILNRKKNKDEKPAEQPVKAEPAVETTKAESASVVSARVIIKPLITEKAAVFQSLNKYAFLVDRKATKPQIKRAIKDIYGIEPISVNVANIEGKAKRFGKSPGRRKDFRKALVTLPQGKTITIHEGV